MGLEFGTGGLRGIMGAGEDQINTGTIQKATQGLANYILKQGSGKRGVAIAFDTRNMSSKFCEDTALCLAANGIKAYVFPSPHPTPMLSFALRELGCIAGVVITASHNPPEYNGYKVYWEDGAQVTAPRDREIIREVDSVSDFTQIKTIPRKQAEEMDLYEVISSEIDDRYMETLQKLVIRPEILKEQAANLKIVYTPLHGTGNLPVRRILRELGFTQVYIVEEQEHPNGDFPTVSYPNPEDEHAFDLALKLAKEVDADLVLATDPDADRLGVYAKDAVTGNYKSFTGNMSGTLILEYILAQKKTLGILPENGAIVTTIVSGKMARKIAQTYHVKLIETLTGFKYIGEQIKFFEQERRYEYLFGYEESYGCLIGTYARDKDAVSAVMALCEVAAWCKSKDMTLCEQMEHLYKQYGFYKETLSSITLKGADGIRKISTMMEEMRRNPPKQIGGMQVTQFRDYQEGMQQNCATGEVTSTKLPKSNVLYFELGDGAWCCIRPSGTEPKIKFYAGVNERNEEDAQEKLDFVIRTLLESIKE